MQQLFNLFFNSVRNLCTILLGVQVLACATVFFGRYVLGVTPVWADPVAMLCMVWLCVLSSSLAVRADEHLRLTVIDNHISPGALRALNILSALIVLALAVFMVYAGSQLTQLSSRNRLPGLGIPASWMAAVIPITGVCYLAALLERFLLRRSMHNDG